MSENNTEIKLMKDLITKIINDEKKKKRFSFFLKILSFILVGITCAFIYSNFTLSSKFGDNSHVALIDIEGNIDNKGKTSAKNIIYNLDSAFLNYNAKAVIIRINSSGGSPVQASIIHKHIKRLRKITKKPTYAVIEDIGTSGAYLIAIAAEKIYCNQTSIVGSIGVIINSFGYSELIKKLGIERRLYKSGKYKTLMDPFLERNKEDDEIIQHNISIINKYFINLVKQNRENKLSKNYDFFSGNFWLGRDALDLGLIDGFYDIHTLSYEIIMQPIIKEYNSGLPSFFTLFEFK